MSDLSEKSDPSENYKYMKEKNWKLGEIFALHQELPAGCVADLEAAAELVHVPRRRAIVRQGDVCRAFYFNRNGLMRVVHEWDGGRRLWLWVWAATCSRRSTRGTPGCRPSSRW